MRTCWSRGTRTVTQPDRPLRQLFGVAANDRAPNQEARDRKTTSADQLFSLIAEPGGSLRPDLWRHDAPQIDLI